MVVIHKLHGIYQLGHNMTDKKYSIYKLVREDASVDYRIKYGNEATEIVLNRSETNVLSHLCTSATDNSITYDLNYFFIYKFNFFKNI